MKEMFADVEDGQVRLEKEKRRKRIRRRLSVSFLRMGSLYSTQPRLKRAGKIFHPAFSIAGHRHPEN
jgi:hypothetical protein